MPSPQNNWLPVLANEDAREAWAVIDHVANDLMSAAKEDLPAPRLWEHALFLSYLSHAKQEQCYGEAAVERLNQIARGQRPFDHFGLHGGLAGYGWTLQHLDLLSCPSDENVPGVSDVEEVLNTVDGILMRTVKEATWSGKLDARSGLIGLGIYFLERHFATDVNAALTAIVSEVERLSTLSDGHHIWWCSEYVPGADSKNGWQLTKEFVDLGLYSGVLGIIHFLREAYSAGINPDACLRLLVTIVKWFMCLPTATGGFSRFAPWIESGYCPPSFALTSCYGDLAVTSVLLQVLQQLDSTEWRTCAEDLVDRCLVWPADASGLKGLALLGGSIGVAHVFNRMYQLEGDGRILDAARQWYRWTLAQCRQGFEAEISLFSGTPGVALALMAAVTSIPPAWDRMLLLSGRSPLVPKIHLECTP